MRSTSAPLNEFRWPITLSLALVICAFTAIAAAQEPQAALPSAYIDTTWNSPVGGTTWAAHTAAQFTSALQASVPGDVIVLDAGVTYAGNFHLPVKSNPNHQWIYIESSALSSLPAPGKRVSTTDAVNMPKIVTQNVMAALSVSIGASNWRLVGLEVTTASTQGCNPNHKPPINCFSYQLIDTPGGSSTIADSITVDRCYLHGAPRFDVGHAIVANASNFAVVDSFINAIHMGPNESQAVLAYNTPGPLKIVNNYLLAATQAILFGGAGGNGNKWVPSDIEVRNNYLFKPLLWVRPSLNGTLVEKNAFEVKSGQRILLDSNTIENVWSAGQNGYAILLTVRTSQSGDFAVVNDITITNNVLKNVVAGINTLAADDQCGGSSYPSCHNAGSQDRWYIADNLITFYDPTITGGNNNSMLELNPGWNNFTGAQGQIQDVVFQHNTGISAASQPCWDSVFFSAGSQSPPFNNLTSNIWLLDNAFCRQPFGDWGFQGTYGLTQYMGYPSTPPYDLTQRFFGNVLYAAPGDKLQTFPPNNYATTVPFTYVNPTTGDYQLLTPFWTDTTDGQISGVNYSMLP